MKFYTNVAIRGNRILHRGYIKIATERISDEAPMSLMDVME